jgi:hypothetical protein
LEKNEDYFVDWNFVLAFANIFAEKTIMCKLVEEFISKIVIFLV